MSDLLLSSRQKQCLRWAAEGKTSWETGRILRITERTVNFHLQQAYMRLDVHTRAAAVAAAVARGALDFNPSPVSLHKRR